MTITPGPTRMKSEILSVPSVVAGQMDTSLDDYLALGSRLASLDPNLIVTCARGSSDHTATYFKYLVEICLGVPVASIGPSVSSVYRTRWKLEGTPVLAISQSGASDDLRLFMEAATRSGAVGISLTNDVASPLAKATDTVLGMSAGAELAVAATKTYIASLVALAAIVAGWSKDHAMIEALRALPDDLDKALACDWAPALERFKDPGSVFRDRTRARARYCQRSGSEVQGDLPDPGGGVQRRRNDSWATGTVGSILDGACIPDR